MEKIHKWGYVGLIIVQSCIRLNHFNVESDICFIKKWYQQLYDYENSVLFALFTF